MPQSFRRSSRLTGKIPGEDVLSEGVVGVRFIFVYILPAYKHQRLHLSVYLNS